MLDPCQPSRQIRYQWRPVPFQLLLSLSQLELSLCKLMRMLEKLDGSAQSPSLSRQSRKLETLDGKPVRDLRQVRRFVFGRPLEEDVGDGDQRDAGDEEETAVESGQPQPRGAAWQSQPGR